MNDLLKTRFILLSAMVASVAGFFSVQYIWPVFATNLWLLYANIIFMGFFFLAATILLLSTAARVNVLPNGQLCYDPNNWFWQFLKWNRKCGKKRWDNIVSICEAYWVVYAYLLVFAIFVLVLFLLYFGEVNTMVGFGFVGLVAELILGSAWVYKSRFSLHSLVITVSCTLALFVFTTLLVAWDKETSVWEATVSVATYAGIATAILSTTLILLRVVFKIGTYILDYVAPRIFQRAKQVMNEMVLVQGYRSFEEEWCPTLVECPTKCAV